MKGELRKVRIRDILPNPFRAPNTPYNERKIQELIRSLKATGAWPTIVARIVRDGRIEIAFGHHRLEAARRLFGEDYEITVVIKDLTNTEMLKMMIHENLEHGGSSALVEQTAVAAVIHAYTKGEIELEPPGTQTTQANTRYAPSTILGNAPTSESADWRGYTAKSVARWMGWSEAKVYPILAALELQERGLLEQRAFTQLTTTQGKTLALECRSRWSAAEKRARKYESAAKSYAEEAEHLRSKLEETEDPEEQELLRFLISDRVADEKAQRDLAQAALDKGASDIRVVALQAARDFVDGSIGTREFTKRVEKRFRDEYKPDPPEPNDRPEEEEEPEKPEPTSRRPIVTTYLTVTRSLLLVLQKLSESDLAAVTQAHRHMAEALAQLGEEPAQ